MDRVPSTAGAAAGAYHTGSYRCPNCRHYSKYVEQLNAQSKTCDLFRVLLCLCVFCETRLDVFYFIFVHCYVCVCGCGCVCVCVCGRLYVCVCVCVCVMRDDRCRLENKFNQSFTIVHVEFVVGAEGMAISKNFRTKDTSRGA